MFEYGNKVIINNKKYIFNTKYMIETLFIEIYKSNISKNYT